MNDSPPVALPPDSREVKDSPPVALPPDSPEVKDSPRFVVGPGSGGPTTAGFTTSLPVNTQWFVRRAVLRDLPRLVELIVAHALFEKLSVDTTGLVNRLATTLIEPHNRAACFVAQSAVDPVSPTNSTNASIAGYATCSEEYSTWSGGNYLHMDTLYVDDAHRNQSIGRYLVDAVTEHARISGLREVQWQTPDWNTNAVRFYLRLGAQASNKTRFKLAIDPNEQPSSNSKVLDTFTEAWSQRDEKLLRLCLHDEVTYFPSVEVPGAPFVGLENVIAGIRTMWLYDQGSTAELGPNLQSGSTITRTWTYRFTDQTKQEGVDIFTFTDRRILRKDAYRRISREHP